MVEVRSRIVAACIEQARLPDGLALDVLVNDTLYHEKKRLETDRKSPTWAEDVAFWNEIKSSLATAGDAQLKQLLDSIVRRFTDEVRGNFSPWVYQMATNVMPKALPLLLNALSPKKLLSFGIPDIKSTLSVHGETERARRMQELGTVILAPTHVSNLDSPVVGWALHHMGLPPFSYGAGLNLFTNPVMAFFMRNLGAYRVDRNKTAPLYKDILKEYATISLEMGQPNLFFPAGTRVRSGALEERLKLGLLSSGLRAYINNIIHKKERPNIYIVPCTLNYHLVLEAETLIDDHLRREGKSRYIITDDESSKPRKMLHFAQNLVNLDSRITVNIGKPLDPFGNEVDDEGRSIDGRGREVDITRYITDRAGDAIHLPQRDRVYTMEAGQSLAKAFRRTNMVLSTSLVAFALFEHLKRRQPGLDLYRLLRAGDEGTGVSVRRLTHEVALALTMVHELADQGALVLDPKGVENTDANDVVRSALRHFGTYHTHPVMKRRGDRVFTEDMKLLLYYSNRMRGYGLESKLADAGEHQA
ncbi:MAG: glycerol-3-phosphate O-acyltransferase [Myxococcota bacterium]|jgi:glycerol-3-phosphate O-acyltransferase